MQRRQVEVFKLFDSAYPTRWHAEHARTWALRPITDEITPMLYTLPEDAFWTGDLISVELYLGGRQSPDGIHSGGTWTPVIGRVQAEHINLKRDKIEGTLHEPSTHRVRQWLALHTNVAGFPYQNATLLRCAIGEATLWLPQPFVTDDTFFLTNGVEPFEFDG
jgi:hypothetical protein